MPAATVAPSCAHSSCDLAIGRIWAQAPEVDGLTVVMGRGMEPGNVYRCGITKVNGVDLEAVRI